MKRLAVIAAILILLASFLVASAPASEDARRDSGWGCGGPC